MAIVKKANNINIQVSNVFTSLSKTSHENSEEVIIEALKQNLELSSQKKTIMQGFGKDSEKKDKPVESKQLEIKIVKDTFVPLGIPSFKGEPENAKIKFQIIIKEGTFEKLTFKVKNEGTEIYSEEITESLKAGDIHDIQWDGFSKDRKYDSLLFTENKLTAEVSDGTNTSAVNVSGQSKIEWIDLKIDDSNKKIDVNIRVNLKDGGVIGTDPPIYTFSDLEGMALDGIHLYWSRIKSRSKISTDFVTISGKEYKVEVKGTNTQEKSMDEVSLVYNGSDKWLRSSNPGSVSGILSLFGQFAPQRVVYNAKQNNEQRDFTLTSAHEIGHEIIKEFGGDKYSYGHEGSSNPILQTPNTNLLPTSGEVNVMEYYSDAYYDYDRTIASEKDVLGMLWCSKLKINKK
ncbi:hypothetical protein CEY12_17160 [Chryseobacterium sp. T16E-39]|uniref:hypothetical protein n=1 Tax=Chryseobacterium sp. T16E-39 TaxID=2015076 RepID=UPI000B5B2B92|nr:hypothetical protein [Chryseobacterium sp. T16E-39]ASK31735.1 hypothetical protein CEY12_17160 [Chryseobacterium sp. T16E-39]